MGTLEVQGTLDPNQFWSTGSSDGDTAHVTVKRFTFDGKVIRAFDGARVRGRASKAVIDENRVITVPRRHGGLEAQRRVRHLRPLRFSKSRLRRCMTRGTGSSKPGSGRAAWNRWPVVAPRGKNSSYLEVLPVAVRKGSYSLDERAAEYLDRRAKLTKRSASAVLSDLVAEAARQDARDRALEELGEGVEIPEREVQRWLKKLGAM
jgi:hypothetical protein